MRRARCRGCGSRGCGDAWFSSISAFYSSDFARREACAHWRHMCVVGRCEFVAVCMIADVGLLPCEAGSVELPPLPYPEGVA